MKDYKEKYCVICGRVFVPTRGNQVTCSSPVCKHERHKRQCVKWRDDNRDAVRESNRKHMRRKREEPVPRRDTLIAIGYADRQREQTLKMVGKGEGGTVIFKIVALVIILILLVTDYAFLVIASRAEERAERMHKRWKDERSRR